MVSNPAAYRRDLKIDHICTCATCSGGSPAVRLARPSKTRRGVVDELHHPIAVVNCEIEKDQNRQSKDARNFRARVSADSRKVHTEQVPDHLPVSREGESDLIR